MLEAFLSWITHVLLPRRAPDAEKANQALTLEELRAMLQEKTHRTWADIACEKVRLQGRIELLEEQLEAKMGPLDDAT